MKYKKYVIISVLVVIVVGVFYSFVGKNIIINYFLDKSENSTDKSKYYNYILKIDNDNSAVYNMLIDFYIENDMTEETADTVNRAIFADKTNIYAYQQKVKLLQDRGEISTAIKISQAIDDEIKIAFKTTPAEYFEPVFVEIDVPENSTVYYKINAGQYILYSSAIEILDGYYDIYAVAICDNGAVSKVINSEFKVTNMTAPVSFSDIIIAQEVGNQIGYFSQNDIVAEDLKVAESLDLTNFILYDDDILTLSNCLNLTELKLGDVGQITSLKPLWKLSNLSEITIEKNCSSSLFADVVNIKSLDYIKVLNSNIYEIPTANNIPTTLILKNCLISDIFNIYTYKNVKNLDLSDNIITEIYGIDKLKNLDELNLSNNKISDISYICDTISLQKINLSYNKISDISMLSRLVFLKEIDISNNEIASVVAFSNMRYLEILNCSYNNILTLEPLVNSESIKEIHANNNSIIDVSYVDLIEALNYINIENNNLITY